MYILGRPPPLLRLALPPRGGPWCCPRGRLPGCRCPHCAFLPLAVACGGVQAVPAVVLGGACGGGLPVLAWRAGWACGGAWRGVSLLLACRFPLCVALCAFIGSAGQPAWRRLGIRVGHGCRLWLAGWWPCKKKPPGQGHEARHGGLVRLPAAGCYTLMSDVISVPSGKVARPSSPRSLISTMKFT